jgi:hypothetical protein
MEGVNAASIYAQAYARGEELQDYLVQLGDRIAAAVRRIEVRKDLLDRWGTFPEPDMVLPDDEESLRDISQWIKDAESLIQYIVYKEKSSREAGFKLEAIEDFEEAPGFGEDWRYPWIEGWNDPKKRAKMMKVKVDRPYRKYIIGGAIAAGVTYVGYQWLKD